MIKQIDLKNFTVFNSLKTSFSSKINIIIGENGTGKTHLLKIIYSLYSANNTLQNIREVEKEDIPRVFTDKLLKIFMPLDNKLGKLHCFGKTANAQVEAEFLSNIKLDFSFHNNSKFVAVKENQNYEKGIWNSVFIPTKEVLSFMEGFVSLYNKYHMSFDKTYYDICSLLDLPVAQDDNISEKAKWAMDEIENVIGGKFVFHGGGRVTFKTSSNEYSANAMAEGFRKAGILSRLLDTGAIQPGKTGPLFWDEPEANMNPKLMKFLVEILLELSRSGQQIFIATHDYVLLKWFDLLMDKNKEDHVRFHTLYRELDSNEIKLQSNDDFRKIDFDPISETFNDLYDEDINKSFGKL